MSDVLKSRTARGMVMPDGKMEGQWSGKSIAKETRGNKGTEAQVTGAGRTTALDGTEFTGRGRKSRA